MYNTYATSTPVSRSCIASPVSEGRWILLDQWSCPLRVTLLYSVVWSSSCKRNSPGHKPAVHFECGVRYFYTKLTGIVTYWQMLGDTHTHTHTHTHINVYNSWLDVVAYHSCIMFTVAFRHNHTAIYRHGGKSLTLQCIIVLHNHGYLTNQI